MTMIDGTKRAAKAVAVLLCATVAACDDASVGVAHDGKPGIGDMDPNAPPGWPLAIGDPDFVEIPKLGGVRAMFDEWLGNCCHHEVDGVHYRAKFSIGARNGKYYRIYEGHVKAEPQWDVLAGGLREWLSDEEWEDIKTYPGWEELMKPHEKMSEAELKAAMRNDVVIWR